MPSDRKRSILTIAFEIIREPIFLMLVACGILYLVLAEGDRIPADAVILSCVNCSTDESLLTGESVPVRKTAASGDVEKMGKPGGDDIPFIFSIRRTPSQRFIYLPDRRIQ